MALVALPDLRTEADAAAYLGIHKDVLARYRRDGKIGAVKIGRGWKYTDQHLADYLEANTKCPRERSENTKSGTTGSPRSRGELGRTIAGAAAGSTPMPDKHAISALARRTFKRGKRRLTSGSSKNTGQFTPNQPKSK